MMSASAQTSKCLSESHIMVTLFFIQHTPLTIQTDASFFKKTMIYLLAIYPTVPAYCL